MSDHRTISEKASYEHTLIDTGRTDDEGNPIYQCPLCGGDFEDITLSSWTDTMMLRCPVCDMNWEVESDEE